MRYLPLLALGLVACESSPSPTAPTGSFSVVSASPAPGATLSLPAGWPSETRALAPAVTIQFSYPQSLATAIVVVDLMQGENVCLQAEGLQLGPGYAIFGAYVGGTTVRLSGDNFERNISYPLCGTTRFTTDRLRMQLIARTQPTLDNIVNTTVLTRDVAMSWTFSK
jgi:hypothetical protein